MKRLCFVCVALLILAVIGQPAWAEGSEGEFIDLTKFKKHNDADLVMKELAKYPNPQKIVFGTSGIKPHILDLIWETYPNVEMEYTFSLLGKPVRSTKEKMKLYPKEFKKIEELIRGLRYLPNLREMEAFHIVFTFEQLEMLKKEFPQLRVHCRVAIGGHNVKTTATAFSTKHAYYSTRYSEESFLGIKYLENLLALDIGHNAVRDLDFLKYAPDLKILIVADNQISDISPISQLKDLEYLELFKNPLEDISPLVELLNLFDLNMTFCQISNIDPLLKMNGLKRLYLTENPISEEQKQQLRERFPSCDINFDSNAAPTAGGWRQKHPRYLEIVDIFSHGRYKEFKHR